MSCFREISWVLQEMQHIATSPLMKSIMKISMSRRSWIEVWGSAWREVKRRVLREAWQEFGEEMDKKYDEEFIKDLNKTFGEELGKEFAEQKLKTSLRSDMRSSTRSLLSEGFSKTLDNFNLHNCSNTFWIGPWSFQQQNLLRAQTVWHIFVLAIYT